MNFLTAKLFSLPNKLFTWVGCGLVSRAPLEELGCLGQGVWQIWVLWLGYCYCWSHDICFICCEFDSGIQTSSWMVMFVILPDTSGTLKLIVSWRQFLFCFRRPPRSRLFLSQDLQEAGETLCAQLCFSCFLEDGCWKRQLMFTAQENTTFFWFSAQHSLSFWYQKYFSISPLPGDLQWLGVPHNYPETGLSKWSKDGLWKQSKSPWHHLLCRVWVVNQTIHPWT